MTKQWHSIALLAGAIVAFGCATMRTVKTARAPAPSAMGVEIDTSCHIADTVRVWIDHVVVSDRVMRPRDVFERVVPDGVHTIAATATARALGLTGNWPMTTVTLPAGERYIATLPCPRVQTSPLMTPPQRWAR